MKRYLKNFEVTLEIVKEAIYECLDRNRWTRYDTAEMLSHYASHMIIGIFHASDLIPEIHKYSIEDKTKLYPIVDHMAQEVYHDIKYGGIWFRPIRYQKRVDRSNGKIREIGISSMKQQVYDHIAVRCCKELFDAKIGTYQCASIKGRGQIYGKRAIEKWFRKNPKKCQWIVKCDIRKFYPSVDLEVLKRLIRRDIANEDVMFLLYALINTYNGGLCIGSYLSQFLANYILSYAYHYLDEYCCKIRRGKRKNLIWKKLFYMDDMLLCGPDKRDLQLAISVLRKYLEQELHLTIKEGFEIHSLNEYATDMMGFKMDQRKTTVRKRIFDRADRLYRKYKDPSISIPLKDSKTMVSYYGYFKHSDSRDYLKRTKVARTLDRAKDVIRHEENSKHYGQITGIPVYAIS